jgi:hypothetical protein
LLEAGNIIPFLGRYKDSKRKNGQSQSNKTMNERLIHAASKDQVIQPGCKYRADFNMKAGWIFDVRPRPDTYTISGEVEYKDNSSSNIFYKQINIEINLYPSFSSMIGGALAGSILGTLVRALTSEDNTLTSGAPVSEKIAIFIAPLIFSFVIGLVLTRKKDVQPFLTIEDFWGGIVLGFSVGYLGQDFIKNYFNPGNNSQ